MFFTKRYETLKESTNNEIKPGGQLHLTTFYLHPELDYKINIPQTNSEILKYFFQEQEYTHSLYPFEVYKILDFYIKTIQELENEIVKANYWEKFLAEVEGYDYSELESYIVSYYQYHIGENLEEYRLYENRLKAEKLHESENPKESFKALLNILESKQVFSVDEKLEKDIKYFKGELEKITESATGNLKPEIHSEKKDIPYKIALLNEIGFFDLPKIKNLTKPKQRKIIQKLIGGSDRYLEGNISVLNPHSKEDNLRFTSVSKMEDVSKFLSTLNHK